MNLNIKILAIIKIAILSLGFAISISPSFAKTTLKEVPTSPDSGETIPKDVKDLIYHGGFTGGGGGTGVRLYETKQWVLHELLALLPTYTGINKLTIDGTTYEKRPFDLPKAKVKTIDTGNGSYLEFVLDGQYSYGSVESVEMYPAFMLAVHLVNEFIEASPFVELVVRDVHFGEKIYARKFSFPTGNFRPFPLDPRFNASSYPQISGLFDDQETMAFHQKAASNVRPFKDNLEVKTFFNPYSIDRLDLLSQATLIARELFRDEFLNGSPKNDPSNDSKFNAAMAVISLCDLNKSLVLQGKETNLGNLALGLINPVTAEKVDYNFVRLISQCQKKSYLNL